MKFRVPVIGLLTCSLLLPVLAVPALAQEQRPAAGEDEVRAFQTFLAKIQEYVKLKSGVESAMPKLKPTADVSKIANHQRTLARRIARARSGARMNDVFTEEVSKEFRRIILAEFQGPNALAARKTIQPDGPSKLVGRLKVNDVYPEDVQLTTMPPTLLGKLPPLPQELAYRIVGHDLMLKDTKSGLIIDIIPNAIP